MTLCFKFNSPTPGGLFIKEVLTDAGAVAPIARHPPCNGAAPVMEFEQLEPLRSFHGKGFFLFTTSK